MYTQVLIFGRSLYMKEYLFFDVATRKLVVREVYSSKFREDMRLFILLEFSFSKDERNVFKVVENLFLESQEIESRELKITASECQKISNKINDLTDPIINGMSEEEQERISAVNHGRGLILDEGPTYKVVLRGNAMIPLVFDEIRFGSELYELIMLIDLASRNFPTP
jgi:hypothetical protein